MHDILSHVNRYTRKRLCSLHVTRAPIRAGLPAFRVPSRTPGKHEFISCDEERAYGHGCCFFSQFSAKLP